MKHWIIYGSVNNGYDGFPNNIGEMGRDDYYSGEYHTIKSYEQLIQRFCDIRNAVVYSTRFIEDWYNLNNEKYKKYIAVISPKGKYLRVEREFLVKCIRS